MIKVVCNINDVKLQITNYKNNNSSDINFLKTWLSNLLQIVLLKAIFECVEASRSLQSKIRYSDLC